MDPLFYIVENRVCIEDVGLETYDKIINATSVGQVLFWGASAALCLFIVDLAIWALNSQRRNKKSNTEACMLRMRR